MKEFDFAGAERIGLPKCDDRVPCVEAFEAVTGIEVPTFKSRKLSSKSQGVEFFLLKGKDIPGFIDLGVIDIGATGTDSCNEYENPQNISYKRIAEAMCRFVIMSEAETCEAVEANLNSRNPRLMQVATSKPKDLNTFASWRDLPLKAVALPSGVTLSGSLEIMPQLLSSMGVEVVADLVASGETAEQNGLVEIITLMNVYPALVQKAES